MAKFVSEKIRKKSGARLAAVQASLHGRLFRLEC